MGTWDASRIRQLHEELKKCLGSSCVGDLALHIQCFYFYGL